MQEQSSEFSVWVKGGLIAGGLFVLFTVSMCSWTTVSPSTMGVQTIGGKVVGDVLASGYHIKNPMASVHEVNIGLDTATAVKSEASSKDLQKIHSDIMISFYVTPSSAVDMYLMNPSLTYKDIYVVPALYETMKAVMAGYTAEELITKRAEASGALVTALDVKLKPYHIIVQTVNMTNFGFSDSFNTAIEAKVTASQKAGQAQRDLERIQFEAQQKVATAHGIADSTMIQATADAAAIKLQADTIQAAGGAQYIQLMSVRKWNGVLPTYVGSGAPVPFINIKQ